MNQKIIIGSRGSDLALWQANYVKDILKEYCELDAEIHIIKTKGDQIQHLSFDKIEGKGFFTKEIEEALLKKEIDIAVHSFKDLETTQPEGLVIAAVSKREDPSDVLLVRKESCDYSQKFELKKQAIVGTSSSRRKSQFLLFRPDVELKDLRGNVPTRVDKLRQGQYDAILLAKAGLDRLQLELNDLHVVPLNPTEFIPAPAQGVLAIQARIEDVEIVQKLQKINNAEVEKLINAERSILKYFGGGCQVPLGIYAQKKDHKTQIWISRSLQWEKLPAQMCFEVDSNNINISQIVTQFNNCKPQKVFISTELTHSVFDRMLAEQGFALTATSLIETEVLPGLPNLPNCDWIFFSSKKAVKYFCNNYTIHPSTRIGAIGVGTADELKEFDYYHLSFVGGEETTHKCAIEFRKIIKNSDRILFPGAENSLQTFQKELEKSQIINFPVYKTNTKHNVDISEHDMYVFTSPSNVKAFFQNKNNIPAQAKIIAMGDKTGKEIKKYISTAHISYPAKQTMLSLAREVLFQSTLPTS